MLVIDPSSGGTSLPGYSVYVNGELKRSGEIELKKNRPIHHRLQQLYDEVQALVPGTPTVLVVEKIRGQMAHQYLSWAAGVIIAAGRSSIFIECPIALWRAWAKAQPGFEKSNENDAVAMGAVIVELARNGHGS